MSIVFLVPYVPIPRMIKRINTANSVDNTSVIFWDRGTDEVANLKLPLEVKAHRINVKANEGRPLRRLGATFRFCRKAFSLLEKEKPSCIHVTKTDMLLLVWLYCITKRTNPSVIYEVSDIHGMALNNSKSIPKVLIKKFLYVLEWIGMSVVDRLIVTSESFWRVYYKSMIPKESVLFLPNTPPETVFESYKAKEKGQFRIGFIGKVRYKKQIKLLIDAAERANIEVFIAGNGIDLDEITKYCIGKNNITIYGSYNYKDEIAKLYSSIDCVFSVYDTGIQNVQIALPNRLYEAARCGLPIIVSKGTELADIVENNGLGKAIKNDNIIDLIRAIELLKDNVYRKQIESNCKNYYEKYRYEVTNVELYNTYLESVNN
jgi:succinoglycan biosynthesis protein ExoL